jgi:hypothetical protein
MVYILIFLHFIKTDDLKYFHIGTFPNMKECQEQKLKAEVMVTHNSMSVECLEVRANS